MSDFSTRAIQDDRIMADGRPAHAWFMELERLRKVEQELAQDRREINGLMRLMRIIKVNRWDSVVDGNMHIVVERNMAAIAKGDPLETARLAKEGDSNE